MSRQLPASKNHEAPDMLDRTGLPSVNLLEPISIRKYEGYEPTDIPGLGNQRGKLHRHVGQGHENFTYDLPLVSDGFGPCWAGIIYDRPTGRSCMIHVDDYETKWNQRDQIERHLGLPNSGQREAIIVHGSRTHASEFTKNYFKQIGCYRIDMIAADSGGMHWAIALEPELNVLDVVTKSEQGAIATRYQAFSSAVYDREERQSNHVRERLMQSTWTAIHLTHYDEKWIKRNGHYSAEEFSSLVADAKKLWGGMGTPSDVRDLLIEQEYAHIDGKTLVKDRKIDRVFVSS